MALTANLNVRIVRRRFWLARPCGLLCRYGLEGLGLAIARRFVRVDAYIGGKRVLSARPFKENA